MSASSRLSRLFPLACMALVACPSPAPQPAKPDPIPAEPTEPRPDSPSERPLLHTATDDLPREDDPIALPDGATLRLGSMSLSHPSDVTVVSMSRDGSVIASRGMYENAATLWNSKATWDHESRCSVLPWPRVALLSR